LIERKPGVKILMETRVDDILRDEDILGKYKEAEIDHIYAGVEATSQAALDAFRKNIKVEESRRALDLINKHDIVSEMSFVLGMPDDTKDSIRTPSNWRSSTIPTLPFSWPSPPGPIRRFTRCSRTISRSGITAGTTSSSPWSSRTT
jgi:anaerobic magnesium-protoporphyrin IX monomethyl ester cyclase